MNYREQFALGVRLFGVWLITRGVYYIAGFADMKLYPGSDRARDSAGHTWSMQHSILLWPRSSCSGPE